MRRQCNQKHTKTIKTFRRFERKPFVGRLVANFSTSNSVLVYIVLETMIMTFLCSRRAVKELNPVHKAEKVLKDSHDALHDRNVALRQSLQVCLLL